MHRELHSSDRMVAVRGHRHRHVLNGRDTRDHSGAVSSCAGAARDVSNRGYGAACNAGAAHAGGEWLLMVNSDVELREQDSLSELLRHAEARVLSGRQTMRDGLAESKRYARVLGSALHG